MLGQAGGGLARQDGDTVVTFRDAEYRREDAAGSDRFSRAALDAKRRSVRTVRLGGTLPHARTGGGGLRSPAARVPVFTVDLSPPVFGLIYLIGMH